MGFVEFIKERFSEFTTKVVIALVIAIIGFIIGKVLGRLVHGILHEIELNKMFEKAGFKINFEEMTGNFVSYFVYFISILMALNQIGVTTIVLNILAGGIIILIIVSLILAFKDYIPNMVAGMFIRQKRLINVGDRIKAEDIEGRVVNISLVETQVETKEKDVIYVPNSLLIKKKVTVKRRKNHNFSRRLTTFHICVLI